MDFPDAAVFEFGKLFQRESHLDQSVFQQTGEKKNDYVRVSFRLGDDTREKPKYKYKSFEIQIF